MSNEKQDVLFEVSADFIDSVEKIEGCRGAQIETIR